MLVRWIPASEGAVKLNVDASSRGNPGPAGCGGLLRDDRGKWIVGFVSHIGVTGSLLAELVAIRHGLFLAWELGYRKIECESDCLMAVKILGGDTRDFDDFYIGSIVDKIDELIDRPWDVTIHHVHREANSCADFLAKIGSSSRAVPPLGVLTLPPLDMSPLLLADSKGAWFSRG